MSDVRLPSEFNVVFRFFGGRVRLWADDRTVARDFFSTNRERFPASVRITLDGVNQMEYGGYQAEKEEMRRGLSYHHVKRFLLI